MWLAVGGTADRHGAGAAVVPHHIGVHLFIRNCRRGQRRHRQLHRGSVAGAELPLHARRCDRRGDHLLHAVRRAAAAGGLRGAAPRATRRRGQPRRLTAAGAPLGRHARGVAGADGRRQPGASVDAQRVRHRAVHGSQGRDHLAGAHLQPRYRHVRSSRGGGDRHCADRAVAGALRAVPHGVRTAHERSRKGGHRCCCGACEV